MSKESLRRLIIKLYAESGFNNCRIQPLKMMNSDKPLQLFVDPTVKPVAIHKAAIIPIHLKARVKADLDRDVRLGILEKVDIKPHLEVALEIVEVGLRSRRPIVAQRTRTR